MDDQKKNKRTYKSEEEKLNQRIEVRFTIAEKIELRQNVANSKHNSISGYIRAKIYNTNPNLVASNLLVEKQKEMNNLLLGLSSQFPIIIDYLSKV